MSAFIGLLNRTITVNRLTDTGTTDGGGNPIYTEAAVGTVRGRIDPVNDLTPDEREGTNVNPIINRFIAITTIPSGFTIGERDSLVSDGVTYDVLGVTSLDGRSVAHHLEIDCRKVTA